MDCRGVSTKSGDFLYSENGVVLKTIQVGEESAREVNGKKLVLAGTVVPSNDENAEGIVFDNVSVGKGETPASCVVAGRIDGSKVYITDAAKRKLERGGVKFYEDPYKLLKGPQKYNWWGCGVFANPFAPEEVQKEQSNFAYDIDDRWTAWEPIHVMQIHVGIDFDVTRWNAGEETDLFDKSEFRILYMGIDHWYDDTIDVKERGIKYYKEMHGDAYKWMKFRETEWLDAGEGIQYRAIEDRIELRNGGETINDKKFKATIDLVVDYDYEIADWRKQDFKPYDENITKKQGYVKFLGEVFPKYGWNEKPNEIDAQSDEQTILEEELPAEEQSDEVEPAEEETADEP